MNNNTIYWIWLADIFGPANRRVIKLLREFGNAYNIFKASEDDILDTGVLGKHDRFLAKISEHDLGEAQRIIKRSEKLGVGIITPDSREYPGNLRALMDAPLVLYYVGELPDFEKMCLISVVGSREVSEYGKIQAYKIGYGLGAAGAVAVSGLALGVDGVSMAAAIDAGGRTLGVCGAGVDVVYPKQHKKLFDDVRQHGVLISEYPPGTQPSKYTFPQRNRIISGISQGTAVVEAKSHSGALITARCAAFQGRGLFAVPGSVDFAGAKGPIKLIKDGAVAVTCAEDILENYSFLYPHTVNLAKMRLETAGLDWKELAEKSVSKHEVGYKRAEEKPVSASSETVSAPEVKKEEKSVVSASRKRPLSEKNSEAPFGKFIGKGKVDKALRIDFEMLGENEKKVYFAMPCDTPLMPEEIKADSLSVNDVLASLTLLEMSGAVEAGAGGYYLRSSEDEIESMWKK